MLEMMIKTEKGVYGLTFQHSLRSVADWEEKYGKPFLSIRPEHEKTQDELIDYYRMMGRPWVTLEHLAFLTVEEFEKLNEHINAKATATWFKEDPNQKKDERIITAEVVYGWMFELGIPLEFENRHFNKLMTLIRVMSEQRNPDKDKRKMSKSEILARNKALNEKRRAQMNSKG